MDRESLAELAVHHVGCSFQEGLKRADRLKGRLRKISERFQNAFSPEKESLGEAYLNGRFEIVLYGDWAFGENKSNWLARITPDSTVGIDTTPDTGVYPIDTSNGNGGQDEIMFVVVVQLSDGPKLKVPSFVRLYLIEDEALNVPFWEGFLYRSESRMGHKSLPFFREGEVDFWPAAHKRRREMVEGRTQIVDRVSDDESKHLVDWLFGDEGKLVNLELLVSERSVAPANLNPIDAPIKRLRAPDQFFDVAIGPLDL